MNHVSTVKEKCPGMRDQSIAVASRGSSAVGRRSEHRFDVEDRGSVDGLEVIDDEVIGVHGGDGGLVQADGIRATGARVAKTPVR